MDGEGGWLLPGLIELHTDNLDKFFTPRPKVDWPAHSAMSSHDALMVASGITTVLDAVAIGDVRDGGDRLENLEKMINAVEETQKRGLNRAEHRLHLRCELPHHTTLPLFEKLVGREPVTLVSLMDHSPGSVSSPTSKSTANTIRANTLCDDEMAVTKKSSWRLAAPGRSPTASHRRHVPRPQYRAGQPRRCHARSCAESHQLGSVIAEFPPRSPPQRPHAARHERPDGRTEHRARRLALRQRRGHKLASLGLLDISLRLLPASLLDAAFRVADDEGNASPCRRRSVW
jgi:alpha-D-ribose 1-methylphosphonate 5-triphosphate diphosphatase